MFGNKDKNFNTKRDFRKTIGDVMRPLEAGLLKDKLIGLSEAVDMIDSQRSMDKEVVSSIKTSLGALSVKVAKNELGFIDELIASIKVAMKTMQVVKPTKNAIVNSTELDAMEEIRKSINSNNNLLPIQRESLNLLISECVSEILNAQSKGKKSLYIDNELTNLSTTAGGGLFAENMENVESVKDAIKENRTGLKVKLTGDKYLDCIALINAEKSAFLPRLARSEMYIADYQREVDKFSYAFMNAITTNEKNRALNNKRTSEISRNNYQKAFNADSQYVDNINALLILLNIICKRVDKVSLQEIINRIQIQFFREDPQYLPDLIKYLAELRDKVAPESKMPNWDTTQEQNTSVSKEELEEMGRNAERYSDNSEMRQAVEEQVEGYKVK